MERQPVHNQPAPDLAPTGDAQQERSTACPGGNEPVAHCTDVSDKPGKQQRVTPLFDEPWLAVDGVRKNVMADHRMVSQHPASRCELVKGVAGQAGVHRLPEKNSTAAEHDDQSGVKAQPGPCRGHNRSGGPPEPVSGSDVTSGVSFKAPVCLSATTIEFTPLNGYRL